MDPALPGVESRAGLDGEQVTLASISNSEIAGHRRVFLLLPTAPSSLLYMRAGAPSAALPPGYAVVDASTFAGTPHASTPLPVALRELWPDKFTSDSAAKRACRRKMVRVDGAVGKCS